MHQRAHEFTSSYPLIPCFPLGFREYTDHKEVTWMDAHSLGKGAHSLIFIIHHVFQGVPRPHPTAFTYQTEYRAAGISYPIGKERIPPQNQNESASQKQKGTKPESSSPPGASGSTELAGGFVLILTLRRALLEAANNVSGSRV